MMGIKEREFRPLPDSLSLEELVPKDNFYRRLERRIDLSFVRELVVDRYAAMGRTSNMYQKRSVLVLVFGESLFCAEHYIYFETKRSNTPPPI
jgi:hypothetical protein